MFINNSWCNSIKKKSHNLLTIFLESLNQKHDLIINYEFFALFPLNVYNTFQHLSINKLEVNLSFNLLSNVIFTSHTLHDFLNFYYLNYIMYKSI